MTSSELDIRQRLKDDFVHYAAKCLTIRTKSGSPERLELNEAQKLIHERIEQQLKDTGKVRAIVLKGRQQGCSTYIEARFYWKVTHAKGRRAFILTHEDDATSNLFEIAKRYHENCPQPVKPVTAASSAKELYFGLLDSGYKVGTAGNKSVGRSSTIQYFHGSEVGFWPNAEEHAAGILQAIPDDIGTEIILESTANGLGNFYHKKWQEAEAGQSEFIAVFVPWFMQKDYRKTPPQDFNLSADEEAYKIAYQLDNAQMLWRRNKIIELGGDMKFKQEYPATSSEAFQVSGLDPLIIADITLAARKGTAEGVGARALGVDPARFGDDRTSICMRQGREVKWLKSYTKKDTMEVSGIVATIIKSENILSSNGDRVFIDVGGLGAGVFDRLCELVDKRLLVSVNFGGSPIDSNKYRNKRAEMWGELKEWLINTPCSIPDSDELQADLTQIRYKYDSNGALELEKKEDMKKRGFRSPDCGDALALTFAKPVFTPKPATNERRAVSGGWMR